MKMGKIVDVAHNLKLVGLKIGISGICWVKGLQGCPAEVVECLGALSSLEDKLLEPFLSTSLPARSLCLLW